MFESKMETWADNYSVFEAILQGSRFEHGSRLRLVVVRHDHVSGAFIGIQWNGFVRHHFDDKLDESSVAANLYIPQSVVTHQLRVIASRDHSEANERDVGRWRKFLQMEFPIIFVCFLKNENCYWNYLDGCWFLFRKGIEQDEAKGIE